MRDDKALRARLEEATSSFTGDKADARAVFDAVVAPLAADAGMPFTYDEATAAADDVKEIDEADLEAFAGGGVEFSGGLGIGVCKEAGGGVGGSYSPDTDFQTVGNDKMKYVCIGIGAGSEGRKNTTFSFCIIGGVSIDW